MVAMLKGVLYYGVFVWFKKPTIDGEKVYTYHKTSQIKTIVVLFPILIIIKGMAVHLLIQLSNEVGAWFFTVGYIYALFYILGLYNSTRYLPHMMNGEKLIIRNGYVNSIELNISNIETIKTAKQGGIEDEIPKETYYSLLTMDSPQYEIFLREPVLMKGLFGRKKYIKTVVFRCDEPDEMINRINSIIDHIPSEKA